MNINAPKTQNTTELELAKKRLKWRYRLTGLLIGAVVEALVGAFLQGTQFGSAAYHSWEEKPRHQTFLRECSHPTFGNVANFDHQSASQNACQIFPATIKVEHFHPYHGSEFWKYWLSIGHQTLADENGTERSGNPEAIGYYTRSVGWKSDNVIRVNALFWDGQLMTVSSAHWGDEVRIQTLANPTTSALVLHEQSDLTFFLLLSAIASLPGMVFGFVFGDTRYLKSSLYKNSLPDAQVNPNHATGT